jgi:hypothetical protein
MFVMMLAAMVVVVVVVVVVLVVVGCAVRAAARGDLRLISAHLCSSSFWPPDPTSWGLRGR